MPLYLFGIRKINSFSPVFLLNKDLNKDENIQTHFPNGRVQENFTQQLHRLNYNFGGLFFNFHHNFPLTNVDF